jgi:hypothetical protein
MCWMLQCSSVAACTDKRKSLECSCAADLQHSNHAHLKPEARVIKCSGLAQLALDEITLLLEGAAASFVAFLVIPYTIPPADSQSHVMLMGHAHIQTQYLMRSCALPSDAL